MIFPGVNLHRVGGIGHGPVLDALNSFLPLMHDGLRLVGGLWHHVAQVLPEAKFYEDGA